MSRPPSSLNAKTALEKAVTRFDKDITVANDNGGEYMDKAKSYLVSLNITQYWTSPYVPQKTYIERLIGTLQKECPDRQIPLLPDP